MKVERCCGGCGTKFADLKRGDCFKVNADVDILYMKIDTPHGTSCNCVDVESGEIKRHFDEYCLPIQNAKVCY